jgi:hypothetical protein
MLRLVLASLLAGLIAVPAATAATPNQILRDCEDDGVLQGDYSADELREARRRIPTDLDQYTDCRDVLARATSEKVSGRAAGGGARRPGAGGPGLNGALLTPETEQDHKALGEATATGGRPVDVGGERVVPGAAGFAANAARNDLPPTLLVLLALMLIAAAAAASPAARRLGPVVLRRVLRRG